MEPKTIGLQSPNTMGFYVTEDEKSVEIIKLSKEGFFYRGEKVEDVHNVYERFNEWLSKTEQYEKIKE